jgi:hypothetical protein
MMQRRKKLTKLQNKLKKKQTIFPYTLQESNLNVKLKIAYSKEALFVAYLPNLFSEV